VKIDLQAKDKNVMAVRVGASERKFKSLFGIIIDE
jgi:hypothetical protein